MKHKPNCAYITSLKSEALLPCDCREIGPAPIAAEVASIDMADLRARMHNFLLFQSETCFNDVVKFIRQAVADALAGQAEGLVQCVAERDHAREYLLIERKRAEKVEAERDAAKEEARILRFDLLDEKDGNAALLNKAALAQVAGGQVAVIGKTGINHELKTDPAVFESVVAGLKTHEIRFNDRDFQVGDNLILRETTNTGAEIKAGKKLEFTGRLTECVISHVLSGYGLADGWTILSFATPQPAPVAGPVGERARMIEFSLRQIIEADDAQALTDQLINIGRAALAPSAISTSKGAALE